MKKLSIYQVNVLRKALATCVALEIIFYDFKLGVIHPLTVL